MLFFRRYHKILLLLIATVWVGLFFGVSLATAQGEDANPINLGLTYGQQTGLGMDDIRLVIARIIRAALGLLGIVVLAIMLYGGYTFMTAAGNEEKVTQGKKILINGTIGLLIILSALSITQFILNKLAGATGADVGGGSQQCADPAYFATHLEECSGSDFCRENPQFCCEEKMNLEGLFVALSITPKTSNTNMNNVAARAVFNMPIGNQFSADNIIKVLNDKNDITNQFDYQFVTNNSGQNIGVEASFKPDNGVCGDDITACLERGNYQTIVNDQLISESGKTITTGTTQCPYPLSADFVIRQQGFNYLNFSGSNAIVNLDSPSTANFTDRFSISFWFKAEDLGTATTAHLVDKQKGGSPGAGYLVYLGKLSNGTHRLLFDLRRGDASSFPIPPQIISLQQWYHVVWIYDGTNSRVYLNGILKSDTHAVDNSQKSIIPYNEAAVSIGGEQNNTGRWFKGGIDELRFYDRVLSLDEVVTFAEKREGPYDNVDERSGLVAGYRFNEISGTVVDSYSIEKHSGDLQGSGYSWLEQKPAKVKDITPPNLSKISLNGSTGIEKVLSGRLYVLSDIITDESGIGYGRVMIERTTSDGQKTMEVDYFNGPAVMRQGGSDAPTSNPYIYKYPWVVQKVENQSVVYKIVLDVWDIDHNKTTASMLLLAVPDHCSNGVQDSDKGETDIDVGGPCGDNPPGSICWVDSQCSCGKCVDNKCTSQPKILDILPMNGATGNWVTVIGKCFGNEIGKVEFNYDADKSAEALVVDCAGKKSWNNSWIIVEVPADDTLPLGSKSNIKVEHKDSTEDSLLLDYANDDFGIKLGLFEKNNIKRPGLCAVAVYEDQKFGDIVILKGATIAPPKTKVELIGSGLGSAGEIKFGGILNNQGLMSGGVQTQYSSWSDKVINSQVPTNMKDGSTAVYVNVDGEPSNGVPFTIKNIKDLAENIPVIDQIDPTITTLKSWITIYGRGFGELPGVIYLSNSAAQAKICAQNNGGDDCVSLDLNLPKNCGNTWSDTQIIAAVPENAGIRKYFLVLKNEDNLYSDGEDTLEITVGPPLPGICKLEPNFGSAPLPHGEALKLYGTNFSGQISENNIYFWQNKSDINKVVTWLSASSAIINKVETTKIETQIPMDGDGLSMQTGPIKVGVKLTNTNEVLSNSVRYEVTDCRKEDAKLKKILESQGLQCCAKDGPEVGRWKAGGQICAGEPRTAGYIWRFTTGKIHQLPKVVENCNEIDWNKPEATIAYPSPIPSVLWTKGKEACLNATIAVRFTVPMDGDVLQAKDEKGNFINVKVFECYGTDEPECDNDKKGKLELSAGEFDMAFNSNILEIRKVPPKSNLKPSQWYHVELSDKIVSSDCAPSAQALTKCYKDSLQKTKPCGAGTAYCFDFKTGDELCTLKNASIAPPSYTVHLLGLVLDPAYPFDNSNSHPYFYFVWGRGSQECSVLNVDGLGWIWAPSKDDGASAMAEVTPTKMGETPTSTDSRAQVWANANAPKGVKITATATNINEQKFVASSTLYIDLFPPAVVKWWPNCLEACINTNIGFRFNLPMLTSSFIASNFKLNQCADETCTVLVGAEIGLDVVESDDNFVARLSPQTNLLPATWYKVVVIKDGVTAIGGTDSKIVGKSLAEDFVGKFRTKADDTPCKISSVNLSPVEFLATSIGQKTKYAVVPKSSPDACSADGQELNPWWFGWKWDSTVPNKGVAEITHFISSPSSTPGCDKNCLLAGSDVSRGDETAVYTCGNNKLEPGEDCEISLPFTNSQGEKVDEIVDQSCSFNCLRLGNSKFSTTTIEAGYCGNGKVEPEFGEECDVKDTETGGYCSNKCTWLGSSKEKDSNNFTAPLCGSGEITFGEDCDIATTVVGCSNQCLHTGTPLAQIWCDSFPDAPQCQSAVSVCGNGKLEQGEECDVANIEKKEIFVRQDKNNDKEWDVITVTNIDKYCSKNCLLQNICSFKDSFFNVKDGGLWCEAGVDAGCAGDCTLQGSSVLKGSLCGDGEVGVGEYKNCEVSSDMVGKYENPIQVVTAKGDGQLNENTKMQTTDIVATALAYWEGGKVWKNLEASKTGKGKYNLQCGNTEYSKAIDLGSGVLKYNDCNFSDFYTAKGVAKNSCCYDRAYRMAEYPTQDANGVCRNTFIAVDFVNNFIEEKSLPGNLTVAVAHKNESPDFSCQQIGEVDVSGEIKNLLFNPAPSGTTLKNEGGFWHNLWGTIRRVFVRLFGGEAKAEYFGVENVVWCAGSIKVVPTIHSEWSKDLSNVTTTVGLYLDKLLPENSTIAVFLRGGVGGIKDSNGVGIRNPNLTQSALNDVWFFNTGADICKLKNVTVVPDSWLFDKPLVTQEFQAVTESTNGQKIVPINGQYNWIWDWQPQNNVIFDIPLKDTSISTDKITIAARNVEGVVVAVANAKITEDIDKNNNQVGQIFTGMTRLEAMFCENPWPPRQYFPFEEGISFGKTKNTSWFDENGDFTGAPLPTVGDEYFNFQMNYCADAGQSGDKSDDLPYLAPKLFFREYPKISYLHNNQEICNNETDDDGDGKIDCLDEDCDGQKDRYGGVCCVVSDNGACGGSDSALFCDGASNSETYRCVECEVNSDCASLYQKVGFACDHGVCVEEDCDNGQDDNGDGKTDCEQTECQARTGFCNFKSEAMIDKSLSDNTLKRFMFFNGVNDDAIGVQIFTNPARVTAAAWLKRNFGSVSGIKTAQIDGYDAVTDGNNYYINALNEASDTKIYNNIYQFSINKDAQQSTRRVFDQLLKSLQFNINISDFGYCLNSEVKVIPDLFHSPGQKSYTNIQCTTDFDCRDPFGFPQTGTDGVCSNAKTKLLRDWVRLPKYQAMQKGFSDYYAKNGKYPDLKSGTYIPGYTVSMWSSWGTLGQMVGGLLPTDKINKWVGCPDAKAGVQTCWNAASSTFSCPQFASVYEYEFVTTTNRYKFHGPLEYFALDSTVSKDFIDPLYFTTERGCVPDTVYSPFGAKCGDGVVNIGEECEPPGKTAVSNQGVLGGTKGACRLAYLSNAWDKSCLSDAECGFLFSSVADTYTYSDKAGVCTYLDTEIMDGSADIPISVVSQWDFGCNTADDCLQTKSYTDRMYAGTNGRIKFQTIDQKFPIFVTASDLAGWLGTERTEISCKNLLHSEDSPYVENRPLPCYGVTASSVGLCTNGYQASKVCLSDCKWSYSSCKSTSVCGNGKVEAGESCDDGGLNETYGHCNKDCNGQFGQFCGNEKIDVMVVNKTTTKPLEVCDKNSEELLKIGYCEGLTPPSYTNHKTCKGDGDCKTLAGFIDFGPCISLNDSSYDFKKENSCSWDCQNYGEYCGDGKVKAGLEECDDGNKTNLDGCDSLCQKENVACLQEVVDSLYIENMNSSHLTLVNVEQDGVEQIENCFINTNGKEICRAAGLSCDTVVKMSSEDGSIVSYDCDYDLTEIFVPGINPAIYYAKCVGKYVINSDSVKEPVTNKPEMCGNGVKETYKDGTVEACDLGTQNGIACSPTYGKSCTYCSADCKKVLTVDPLEYCGNGKIESIEECEVSGQDVITLDTNNNQKNTICADKGSYVCNNCVLSENCLNCGLKLVNEGGVVPKISILNPMITNNIWPTTINHPYVALYRADLTKFFNPYLGNTRVSEGVPNPTLWHNLFWDNSLGGPDVKNGIVTDSKCGSEYGLFFNHWWIWGEKKDVDNLSTDQGGQFDPDSLDNDWEKIKKYGDLFAYPVNNELKEVKKEIIVSPAVKPYEFRIVVRWKKEESDQRFMGILYNKGFAPSPGEQPTQLSLSNTQFPCRQMSFSQGYWSASLVGGCAWLPAGIPSVFVHDTVWGEETVVQAMTVSTFSMQLSVIPPPPFAFFVDAIDESIYSFKDSSLQVEVYEYHEGQIPQYSIYGPTHIFNIVDAANTSDNPSAEYWHVFNLEYNTATKKYEIKTQDDALNGHIVTDWCAMQQYIPGEACNPI